MSGRRRRSHHAAACFCGHQPAALQVCVHHCVVVGLSLLQQRLGNGDASVVDDEVRRSPVGQFVEALAHAGGVGDVEANRPRLATLGSNLLLQWQQLFGTACTQHHACANARQQPREMGSQPAGGAGDQRDASVEAESVKRFAHALRSALSTILRAILQRCTSLGPS